MHPLQSPWKQSSTGLFVLDAIQVRILSAGLHYFRNPIFTHDSHLPRVSVYVWAKYTIGTGSSTYSCSGDWCPGAVSGLVKRARANKKNIVYLTFYSSRIGPPPRFQTRSAGALVRSGCSHNLKLLKSP